MISDHIQPPQEPTIEAKLNPDDVASRMKLELRDIGIPPRPAILEELDRELSKDEPDFIRLGHIISADVGLSAGLIKITNSPFFGLGKKVGTVQEALLLLGLRIVVNTIAGLALRQTFKHVPMMDRFWSASAATARVSGALVHALGVKHHVRPEDAYTFSLFRDCGIPVLMIPFPQEYRDVLIDANNDAERPFTAVEDGRLGINHAAVGTELARNWCLPDEICEAIQSHHNAEQLVESSDDALPPRTARLIALAQLAEYLLQQHTGMMKSVEWQKLGPSCLAVLEITEDDLPRLAEACREACEADY